MLSEVHEGMKRSVGYPTVEHGGIDGILLASGSIWASAVVTGAVDNSVQENHMISRKDVPTLKFWYISFASPSS